MSIVLAAFKQIGDSETAILDLEKRGFESREFSLIVKNETMYAMRQSFSRYNNGNLASFSSVEISPFDYLLANSQELYDPDMGNLTLSGPLAILIQLSEVFDSPLLRTHSNALKSGIAESLQRLDLTEDEAAFLTSYIQQGNILLGVGVFKGEENAVASLFSHYDPEMVSVLPGGESERVVYDGHDYESYQEADTKDTIYYSEVARGSSLEDRSADISTDSSNVFNSLMKKLKKLLS